MSNIEVNILDSSMSSKWDSYVDIHPDATFFHKSAWKKVIEMSFPHKAYFLYAIDTKSNNIKGILPLVHVKSLLFGSSLVSTPFCVYGGCVADDIDVSNALQKKACDLSAELKVDYMEFRNQNVLGDYPEKSLYVTFRKEISANVDENMKSIPRKQRAMVRKGIKAGLVTEIDKTVERFYRIYSLSVRNHGTPVFSKDYFINLKKVFGNDCEIRVVTKDNIPISAVMTFYYKDQVLPYYGGGTADARKFKAFDFMYWEIMKDAGLNGIRIFDYGRSKKGTGSYSFKKNWGFEPEDLHYQYHLVRARELPDLNPLNPKYQLMIKAWKKLPVTVANLIGPYISRHLG